MKPVGGEPSGVTVEGRERERSYESAVVAADRKEAQPTEKPTLGLSEEVHTLLQTGEVLWSTCLLALLFSILWVSMTDTHLSADNQHIDPNGSFGHLARNCDGRRSE